MNVRISTSSTWFTYNRYMWCLPIDDHFIGFLFTLLWIEVKQTCAFSFDFVASLRKRIFNLINQRTNEVHMRWSREHDEKWKIYYFAFLLFFFIISLARKLVSCRSSMRAVCFFVTQGNRRQYTWKYWKYFIRFFYCSCNYLLKLCRNVPNSKV